MEDINHTETKNITSDFGIRYFEIFGNTFITFQVSLRGMTFLNKYLQVSLMSALEHIKIEKSSFDHAYTEYRLSNGELPWLRYM